MFRYYNTESFIHDLNPITKLIMTIFFTITIFISNTFFPIIILLLLQSILLLLTNIPINIYIKHLKINIPIIIILLAMLIILDFDFLVIIISTLKLIMFILFIISMILTTTTNNINYALGKLLPSKQLSYKISDNINRLSNIFTEYNKINDEIENRNTSMFIIEKITLSLKHAIYSNDRREEIIKVKGLDNCIVENKFNYINILACLLFVIIFFIILTKEVIL